MSTTDPQVTAGIGLLLLMCFAVVRAANYFWDFADTSADDEPELRAVGWRLLTSCGIAVASLIGVCILSS